MPSKIRVGSYVSACIGPFIENSETQNDFTNNSSNQQKKKKRKRERYTGIVLGSVSEREWEVYWNETGAISTHATVKL